MFGFGSRKKGDLPDVPELPRLDAVFVSETGLVRAENQDNALVSIGHGVFCVADGVGGGLEGARASAIVCRELQHMLNASGATLSERVASVRRSLDAANDVIADYAASHGYAQMGSTAAALVFDPLDFSRAAAVHVGDSRVYRVRGGLAEALTRDHRAAGTNALTRAVGAGPRLRCDARLIDVRPGDRFVICSDGVHGVVSDARLALFASCGGLETAAERLADAVLRAGAPDNYTFVIVAA